MTDPDIPAPAPAPAPTESKAVAYEHFQRVVTAKQGLESQVQTLKAELSTAVERAANVDTLAGQLTEAQGKTAAAEGRYQTYRDISGALGVTDPEVVELAEWSYQKLPAADRPPIVDWLGTLKDDPAAAPVALRPFLTPAEAAAAISAPTSHTAPAPVATSPRPMAATTSPPGAPASVSAEAIREARERGVKTGDWSRYKELSAAAGYRSTGKA